MANVKLVVNPIAVTNKVVIVVERVDDLGTEITRSDALDPPHTQRNLTFPDLDPVMYRFFFWESVDGVSLDTLLGAADIDASMAFDFVIEVFEVTVNGGGPNDPDDTQPDCDIPELVDCELLIPGLVPAGQGVFTVFKRGIGPMLSTEIEAIVTGGFRLLNGDLFYPGDIFVVFKYSKIIAPTVSSNAVYPSDILTITEESTAIVTNTHLNRMLEMTGEFLVQKLLFDDLDTIPDKKYLLVNTHAFNGNYIELDFTAGGGLWYNGQVRSKFWIPAGQLFAFSLKGGVFRISGGEPRRRGRPDGDYEVRPGFIQAIGTEYDRVDVPGLYDWVESLAPGVACTFAQWGTSVEVNGENTYPYKGCYAIDTVAFKIKVPDLRNKAVRYLKMAADAQRTVNQPGGYQHDSFRSHEHEGTYKQGKSDDNESGVSGGYLRKLGSAGGTNYGNITASVGATGSVETRGQNIGEIPVITL